MKYFQQYYIVKLLTWNLSLPSINCKYLSKNKEILVMQLYYIYSFLRHIGSLWQSWAPWPSNERMDRKFLDLPKFYLINRQQIVIIDGFKSDIKEVRAEVPQRRRFVPLLLITYINNIVNEFIFGDNKTITWSGEKTNFWFTEYIS